MEHRKDLLQAFAALVLPFLSIVLLFTLFSSRIEALFTGQAPVEQLREYHAVAYAGSEAQPYEVYEVSTADNGARKIAQGEPVEPPHDKDCVCCC